jgi:nitrite reductase/ring-hydroxylating ferredoxin subunit
MKVKQYFILIFSILFFSFLLFSCDKDEDIIPYVPINPPYEITLNVANELTIAGNSVFINEIGYGGVVVYCSYYDTFNPSESMYYAYDAACTFEVIDTCSVELDTSGMTATCPCCGSSFNLVDGYPFNGEAVKPLKMYNTTVLNNVLYISN